MWSRDETGRGTLAPITISSSYIIIMQSGRAAITNTLHLFSHLQDMFLTPACYLGVLSVPPSFPLLPTLTEATPTLTEVTPTLALLLINDPEFLEAVGLTLPTTDILL